MERAANLQVLFYISLKFLVQKFLQTKKIFPSLKGPRKERPSILPKSGAPLERDAHFQSLTQHILRGPQ